MTLLPHFICLRTVVAQKNNFLHRAAQVLQYNHHKFRDTNNQLPTEIYLFNLSRCSDHVSLLKCLAVYLSRDAC